MHERILAVRPWPVAVFRKLRVKVVLSLSGIAVGLPLRTGFELALHGSEISVEAVFQGGCKVQFLGVRNQVRVVEHRELCGQAVALLFGVYRRLVGGEGVILMNLRELVFERKGSLRLQGGDPWLAQHPGNGGVGPQCVCPGLGECA